MTKFILRWAINAIALYLAVLILPGIDLRSGLVSIIWLALVIHQPVWWNAFLGGLIVSIVSVILTLILKDEMNGRKMKM